ncbi:glycoside hydrolase family 88 protein [Candidatus Sumerlaeota bacterium]|nr:glycoside hydrolase family 88 protein [Candidatus Sumerlaeota bacterium]
MFRTSVSTCLVLLLASTAVQAAPDPVAWWKLDESSGALVADSSIHANDGTLHNTAETVHAAGRYGRALQLDGVDDYVLVGHDASIDFGDEDLTLSFWIRLPVSSRTTKSCWIVKGSNSGSYDSGSGKRYEIYNETSNNTVRFTIDDDSIKSEVQVSNVEFITGEWVHVGCVRDTAVDELRLYANGVLKGTATDSTGSVSQTEDLYMGRTFGGVSYFPGAIDQIRIYRAALTGPEILALSSEPNPHASEPVPDDGAVPVSLNPTLEWTSGTCALSHDVYFGTDAASVDAAGHGDPEYRGSQTTNDFDPGTLVESTTYSWRIDEINGTDPDSPWKGVVWHFTTLGLPAGPASAPTPADGATNVDVNAWLGWTAAAGATEHDVYFGTENPPPYQGRVSAAGFNPATLGRNRTYYWRIDEVNDSGSVEGSVWHFTTEAEADVAERYKWPQWLCQSTLNRYPSPNNLVAWHYEEALVLSGLYEVWKETGGPNANLMTGYVQPWADRSVNSDGTIDSNYNRTAYALDNVAPGRVLMAIYAETAETKYLDAAGYIMKQFTGDPPTLDPHPRTSEGGYWHVASHPWEMWLDGLYMGQPFSAWYGETMGEPQWFDEATSQILLMASHTQDPATGLLYHAWHDPADPGGDPSWADPVTGRSPEVWGRAVGWYISAIVDLLDRIPGDHPNRAAMIEILKNLVAGLAECQDPDTGLWYQVVDKGHLGDNWLESSCSAFYAYGIGKAVQKGYVDDQYLDNAWRGYRGVLNQSVAVNGANLDLYDTCVGTSVGGYSYYIGRPTLVNDKKGVGALIYASLQMSRMADWAPISSDTFVPTYVLYK